MEMNRRSMPRTLVVVAVVFGLAIASYGCGANIQRGKVLFGTDVPTADGSCSASSPVTSVSTTTSVYATYVFKAKPGSDIIVEELTKDGTDLFPKFSLPTADTQGLDCFADTSDLSKLDGWGAGAIHIKLTDGTDTVAEGDLTVK
jgi:hypothetical protein